jgi:hypothetical protein
MTHRTVHRSERTVGRVNRVWQTWDNGALAATISVDLSITKMVPILRLNGVTFRRLKSNL